MRRLLPLVVLLAASLAALLAAPLTAEAKPGVAFGIEQFGNMENPTYTGYFEDTMVGDGARVFRYTLRWDWVATCDPRTRGDATNPANACYDWSRLDQVVNNADRRGLSMLYSVYGTPDWVFHGPVNYTGGSDQDFATFTARYAEFVQAAATRFDGRHGHPRVTQWTIWNEPNGNFFEPRWVGDQLVGPQRYARLYDAAARRIKAVDSTLQVAVGPTAPHSPKLPPITWTQAALPVLQSLGSPIDAWAHNAYTGKQSPMGADYNIAPPYVGLGNVNDLTNLLDRYSVTAGKPLWITEFGYQTSGFQVAITPEQQPQLLADALYFAWLHPRITTFIWYGLHDDGDSGTAAGFQTALYFGTGCGADGSKLCPKPGAGMYRHTVWASGRARNGQVTLWGQGRMQPASTRIFVQRPGDGWRAYYNTDTAQTGTVHIRMVLPLNTIVMTCDVLCGPQLTVKAGTVTGGGTAGATSIQRLRSVRLSKRASLSRGIQYGVNCTSCTVTARILARGPISGIAAARHRTIVVGSGRVRSTRTGKIVYDRFTLRARRELARRRTGVVILRTYIRYSTGRRVITDRPVRLV